MKNKRSRLKQFFRIGLTFVVLLIVLQSADLSLATPLEGVANLVRWDEFNFVSWVAESLIERTSAAGIGIEHYISNEQQSKIVLKYFEQIALVEKLEIDLENAIANPLQNLPINETTARQSELNQQSKRMHAYARVAESILQNQTERSLRKLEFGLGGQILPPVLFKMTDLPLNLIISSREKIGTLKSISLNPGMDSVEKEELENQIQLLYNFSALVEPVGGLGAYPTMVMRTQNINWLSEVVAHEWIHNYLSFYPLGVRYFENNDLRSMNETLANLAGKEIGRRTILDYYPDYVSYYRLPGRETITVLYEGYSQPFNYRGEMRQTRMTVDYLLENGEVERAESYMETRRQYFWENGYRLRKLNQAYFAFYGSYNDTPGGGASGSDPIGPAVQELRTRSSSLKVFVDRMKNLTSFSQLLELQ